MHEQSAVRVAAVQLQPELGNVDANLKRSSDLVRRAIGQGARWIMLHEFFTTGIIFDDRMWLAPTPISRTRLPDGQVFTREVASETLKNQRLRTVSSFESTVFHERGGRGEIYRAQQAELLPGIFELFDIRRPDHFRRPQQVCTSAHLKTADLTFHDVK